MTVHRAAVLTVVIIAAWAATPCSAGEWRVHGAVDGTLIVNATGPGRVKGTLSGDPVDGYLVNRRLVFLRCTGDDPQLWEGWLSDDANRISGTVTLGSGQQQPWYALRQPGATDTIVVPRPPRASPTPPWPTATATPAPPEVTRTPSAPQAAHGPWLTGRWHTPTGTATIQQTGRRLELTLPDGRTVGGRITGDASLVAGLRLGCCRASLEGSDRIRWEDDAVWLRETPTP